MIRADAGCSVSRFAELVGVPRRTYHGRLARHRAPHTNGVVERWFESLKYEHLYRHDIASGIDLADHVAAFTTDYNTIRPHQALDQKRPLDAYLGARTPQPNPPKNAQSS